jgi:hypothetical protein
MNLVGFLILLALMLVAAYATGPRPGPVTSGHSQIQYTGGSPVNAGGASGDE